MLFKFLKIYYVPLSYSLSKKCTFSLQDKILGKMKNFFILKSVSEVQPGEKCSRQIYVLRQYRHGEFET